MRAAAGPRRRRPLARGVAVALVLVAALAGCGKGTPRQPGEPLRVVVGFYPLQFVAEQVGGDEVTVRNLVQPGGEAHDLELSPRQVADVADAELVVFLGGFQPALDEAVMLEAAGDSLDVGTVVPLLTAPGRANGPAVDDQVAEAAAGGKDPHLWLDPTLLAAVADAVADRLAAAEPAASAQFHARAAALRDRLTELDQAYRQALASCARRQIVVSHAAFGYLARRYRLDQIAINGLDPEAEPTPQRLAEVASLARASGATTIFFETLVSPAVSQAIASEVGARTAVLDPIEGAPPGDYLTAMRDNLTALTAALGCA